MQQPSQTQLVEAVLARHGRTYCAELDIDIARNTPSVLFRWLCAAILFSARIRAEAAVEAAAALTAEGWTTPQTLLEAGWEARTRVLNRSGYARYDESTSRMLGDTCTLLLDEYGGDLRRLRAKAAQDPQQERALLMACKGLGQVGADIFCREIQTVWREHYPFADKKALDAARSIGLPATAGELAALAGEARFVPLVTGLVRMALQGDANEVIALAGAKS